MDEMRDMENYMSKHLLVLKWHMTGIPERRMYFYSRQKEGGASEGLLIHFKHH